MKNEKLFCPNEINLNQIRAEIQAEEPTAKVFLLPDNIVQIAHDTEKYFAPIVEAHDGAAQNEAESVAYQWELIKIDREIAVNNITVEVDGMEFDGDEVAQGRMTRAVAILDDLETTPWKLADNTLAMPSKEQLKTALRLAGLAQTQIWTEFVL